MAETVGNYELLEFLQESGPSRFYRARNRILGNEVVVRRLAPQAERLDDQRDTFFREMRHAAALRHPHLSRPLDVFEADGHLWSVSEPRLGTPTSDRVTADGPLPLVQALRWGAEVGDALVYLHGKGFVSGRVSPRWILVDDEGPLLVAFTKSADLAAGIWPLRPVVLGLSAFSAPEELRGERPTPRSEVYSLAATVAWWLTRAYPYGGATEEEAIRLALGDGARTTLAALRPDVPRAVAGAIDAALHRDPAQRVGSAASLTAVLSDAHRRLDADVPHGFTPGTRLALDGLAEEIEILHRHGSGAFGVVLRARAGAGTASYAVKTLKSEHGGNGEVRQRFVREARVLQGIAHPNVVGVAAVGEQGAAPFVVMEFVEGPDLGTLLLREGALPPTRATRIAAGIARGLAAIHAHGIVHRDLKPHNVLLAAGDRAVIADFGLARDLNNARMTLTGAVVGTPAYMAPELVAGGETGFEVDLYALGAIAYEMLAGRPPIQAADALTLLRAVVHEAPPPLPAQIPAGLRGLVGALLSKDPTRRPSDLLRVAAAFEAAADGCAHLDAEGALSECAADEERASATSAPPARAG